MITFPIENCPRCNEKLLPVFLGWSKCQKCPIVDNYYSYHFGPASWFEVKNSTERINIETQKYSLSYLKNEGAFEVLNSNSKNSNCLFKISLSKKDLALSEIELNKLLDQYLIFS